MKKYVLFVVVIGAVASMAFAGSKLGPGFNIDLTGKEAQIIEVSPGVFAIQLDDMLFPYSQTRGVSYGTLWTDKTVYYQFDPNVDAADGRPLSGDGAARRAAWREAAGYWSAVTGLVFIEGTGSGNYISVESADGNSSWVGMIGGSQYMKIYNWNYKYIIAHEIGHAMSVLHEQSRSDRDTYITVNYANIQDDREYNYDSNSSSTACGSYDYDSVMHYGRCSFWDSAAGTCGTNGYTMDAVPAGAASVGMTEAQANSAMGQRNHLSSTDKVCMNTLYPGSIFTDAFETGTTDNWDVVSP